MKHTWAESVTGASGCNSDGHNVEGGLPGSGGGLITAILRLRLGGDCRGIKATV